MVGALLLLNTLANLEGLHGDRRLDAKALATITEHLTAVEWAYLLLPLVDGIDEWDGDDAA